MTSIPKANMSRLCARNSDMPNPSHGFAAFGAKGSGRGTRHSVWMYGLGYAWGLIAVSARRYAILRQMRSQACVVKAVSARCYNLCGQLKNAKTTPKLQQTRQQHKLQTKLHRSSDAPTKTTDFSKTGAGIPRATKKQTGPQTKLRHCKTNQPWLEVHGTLNHTKEMTSDTCGIRIHTGRPHRLSRPTP